MSYVVHCEFDNYWPFQQRLLPPIDTAFRKPERPWVVRQPPGCPSSSSSPQAKANFWHCSAIAWVSCIVCRFGSSSSLAWMSFVVVPSSSSIGHVPPAELEAEYHRKIESQPIAA
jgi:hypothetical protein